MALSGTDVFYLAWPPLGEPPLEQFAASYRQHSAGCEHGLCVVLKGSDRGAFAHRCHTLAERLTARVLVMPDMGKDLDTYRAVARTTGAHQVCFLNTSTEILADQWLERLRAALRRPGVGLVGATASYESARSSAPRPLRPLMALRYRPFPNPHIRTNAFMLQRDLMLALDWRPAQYKRAALELESGKRGITGQVQARGLSAVVVGRDVAYDREHWYESRTFRSGDQENLLIADNRTRQYADADPARRAQLAAMAWGQKPGA